MKTEEFNNNLIKNLQLENEGLRNVVKGLESQLEVSRKECAAVTRERNQLAVDKMNLKAEVSDANMKFYDERQAHHDTRGWNRIMLWTIIALVAFGGVMIKSFDNQRKISYRQQELLDKYQAPVDTITTMTASPAEDTIYVSHK